MRRYDWRRLLFNPHPQFHTLREFIFLVFKNEHRIDLEDVVENLYCPYCGKRYRNASGLMAHLRVCKSFQEDYATAYMIYSVASRIVKKKKIKGVRSWRRYRCLLCKSDFRSRHDAVIHVYLEHISPHFDRWTTSLWNKEVPVRLVG